VKWVCTALLALTPALAMAEDIPVQASVDTRIQVTNYHEDDVVALYVKRGSATQIVFAPGEEILDVASGFTDGWEFKNRRNNLYLKPRSVQTTGPVQGIISPEPGKWDTNLLVATNRRVYTFQLALVSDSDHRVAYRVTFRYPADEAARRLAEAEAALARSRLEATRPVRNTHYTMQIGRRSSAIAPTSAYDDGTFTYLSFPNNREIPAVFLVADDKDRTETLVNTHFSNDVLVIHRVAPELVLRLGSQVVAVFNESYDQEGIAPEGGTTLDGVERVIRQEERVR